MTEYLPAPEPVSPFQTSFDGEDNLLNGKNGEYSDRKSIIDSPLPPVPPLTAPVMLNPMSTMENKSNLPPQPFRSYSTPGVRQGRSSPEMKKSSNGRESFRESVSGSINKQYINHQSKSSQSSSSIHQISHQHSNPHPYLPPPQVSIHSDISNPSYSTNPSNPSHSSTFYSPLTPHSTHNSPLPNESSSNTNSVTSWTSKDIKDWLESLHCGEYFQSFEENHITGETLLECDQVALKYLGIKKVGDRIRINQSLNQLRAQYIITSSSSSKHESKSLEDLNRNSISPFAATSPAKFDSSPLESYFTPKPTSGASPGLPPITNSTNRFAFRRGFNNTRSPPPTTTTTVLSKTQPTNNNVSEIFSMDVVKQNNLKFIYPQGESKTVNIAGCSSADEIKRKALFKIMPDNVANPVDWIVFVAIDDKYRHLGDAELMSISQSTESLERKRLMLCSIGTSPSTKQLEKSKQIQINSHLKLSSLNNEVPDDNSLNLPEESTRKSLSLNRLSLAQSIAATSYDDFDEEEDDETSTIKEGVKLRPRKLGRLSDHRPPSELISSNLAHFFPSAPTNDLEETIRNSRRFSKRMSRMSRISQRMSVSSNWGIPEDDEKRPPLPSLPIDTDYNTITTSFSHDISNTSNTSNTNSGNNTPTTITPDKRPSLRNSIRKSVLSKRYSTNDLNASSMLSSLSNRFSTTITLNKSKNKLEEETEPIPKTEVAQVEESEEEEEEDDDDTEFLATVKQEESCPSKWIKGRLIGSGSFGTVYLGMNSFTGELMAVKQVELPTDSENGQRKKSMVDALQREMNLLREFHHENIVQYLGSNSEGNFLNIFLEYVPGGSVAMLLSNYGVFEESLIRNFVRQILQGLKYLHDQNIIHRDIKGANVLVDNKGCIKISDFGISKKIETKLLTNNRVSLQGSVFWMAPEVVKQLPYTLKADIWSLGCLIVEMFSGTHPFPEFTQMQVIFRLGNSGTPAIPDECSEQAKDFLTKTFAIDFEKRPTASELLNHPFIIESMS